jgi:hypothetical protein
MTQNVLYECRTGTVPDLDEISVHTIINYVNKYFEVIIRMLRLFLLC